MQTYANSLLSVYLGDNIVNTTLTEEKDAVLIHTGHVSLNVVCKDLNMLSYAPYWPVMEMPNASLHVLGNPP